MKSYPKTWSEFFKQIENKPYFQSMMKFIEKEYSSSVCYPPKDLIFNAFRLTKLQDVKVVIIGQDPYHEPNQAMGLSFSVPKNIKVPPSLVNIYKEISSEYNCEMNFDNGDLTYLAKQGVLLLNTILSVKAHEALSHNIIEYKYFLQDVMFTLDKQFRPMCFMLWGGPARRLKGLINNPNHLVLEANHPSPLSANRGGWFGNNHFKLCDDYLKKNECIPILWNNK